MPAARQLGVCTGRDARRGALRHRRADGALALKVEPIPANRLGTNRIGDDGVRYLMEGIVQNGRSLNQIQYVNAGTTLAARF